METKNQNYWKKYWAAYWKTVVKCIAYPEGQTEIYHTNGEVEIFNKQGKRIGIKKYGSVS